MRDRNAGIGRCGNGRSNTGNDLKRDVCIGERNRFFSASPEDIRVASLETNNNLTGFGMLDK